MLLRVVLRVPFDPSLDRPETVSQVNHYMSRIRELARVHTDLSSFELLEVHFYFPVREKELREKTVRRNLQSWQDVDEKGVPVSVEPAEHA